jgi:hypothetical protein
MSGLTEVFKLNDGTEVGTGCLLPTAEEFALAESSYKVFGGNEILDPNDCRKLLENDIYKKLRERRRKRMLQQARLGKCNASAVVSGAHQATETSGQPVKVFSDCHLYMRINGGRDNGSGLLQGMREMETGGLAPRELEDGSDKYLIPHNVFNKSQIPSRWLSVANRLAKSNLGFELQVIPSNWADFVPAMMSAIARDYPIIHAWHVGGSSMNLNNGYIRQGNGRGNHATLIHSGRWVGGKTGVHPDVQNSWGPSPDAIFGPTTGSWGDGGFGLMTMEEAFQCRANHVFWVFVNISLRNENNPLLN